MGVYLGPEQVLAQRCERDGQPKGYWENIQIISLNDAILARHGGSWDEPPISPARWEASALIDDLKERGRMLVRDTFANAVMWGWKDPRNCLTLPFWQQLLPEMRYVVCLRNPVDVAHSLAHRDGFSAEKSSRLWLRYVSSALEHSAGQSRLIVFYEDLMNNWPRELQRLANFLGNSGRAQQIDVREAVQMFIEQRLQHYRTSIPQMMTNRKISFRAKALYLAQRISAKCPNKTNW